MPQALTWTSDPHLGCDRVVRSARRARLLRKRGVVLARLCDTNVATGRQGVYWVWNEHEASHAARMDLRKRKAATKRALRAAGWPLRLDWVERALNNVLVATVDRYAPMRSRWLDGRAVFDDGTRDWAEVEARVASMNAKALADIQGLPLHWTPEQHRDWLTRGFVIEVAPTTPEARACRESPAVYVTYASLGNEP